MKYYAILICSILMIFKQATAQNKEEITLINAGHNGDNTVELLARVDSDVLSKKPQLLILMVGTNDMLNLRNMLSLADYEIKYQELITKIRKKSKLILMTIPPVDNESLKVRIGSDLFGLGPQQRVDGANEIIKKLAKKNSCKLIDLNLILTACGGATEKQESIFQNMANTNSVDGVHPTKNGYLIIGSTVYQTILTEMPKVKSIVFFGDSITYGYKMKGSGTVYGDSYPAVVNRMLNAQK